MKKHEIRIVPATLELMRKFFNREPSFTTQAICFVRDEEVLGVAGVHYFNGKMVVFANICDDIRRDKRIMVIGIRKVLEMMRASRAPVFSISDPDINGADVLLKHMGFIPAYREVHQWQG